MAATKRPAVVNDGIDNQWNKMFTEVIHKEDRQWKNHKANAHLQRNGERSIDALCLTTPRAARPKLQSAAVNFLEEKLGLEVDRPTTRDALYRGVSHEGAGRAAYLRTRRKYDINERHGQPRTETQWVGAGIDRMPAAISEHSKKPIIKQSFYREANVATHRDLPPVG